MTRSRAASPACQGEVERSRGRSLPGPFPWLFGQPGRCRAHGYADFAQTPLGLRQGRCPGEAPQREAPRSLVRERLTGRGGAAEPAWMGIPVGLGFGTRNWKWAGAGMPGWGWAPQPGSPPRASPGSEHASAGRFRLRSLPLASLPCSREQGEGPRLRRARRRSSEPSAAGAVIYTLV